MKIFIFYNFTLKLNFSLKIINSDDLKKKKLNSINSKIDAKFLNVLETEFNLKLYINLNLTINFQWRY